MELINLVLIGIILLFFILLAIKSIFNIKKFCAICLSVNLSWIILLVLYFANIFTEKIIIAILMGHTSLGIFYLWEKKVKEKFKVFRLPLLLTFIFIIYITFGQFNFNGLIIILALWVLFFIIYLFKFNKLTKKLIECCKKW